MFGLFNNNPGTPPIYAGGQYNGGFGQGAFGQGGQMLQSVLSGIQQHQPNNMFQNLAAPSYMHPVNYQSYAGVPQADRMRPYQQQRSLMPQPQGRPTSLLGS